MFLQKKKSFFLLDLLHFYATFLIPVVKCYSVWLESNMNFFFIPFCCEKSVIGIFSVIVVAVFLIKPRILLSYIWFCLIIYFI